MAPQQSHLQPDGTVFPPVTPDPPPVPGVEQIEVPELIPQTRPSREPDPGRTTDDPQPPPTEPPD